MQRIMPLTEEFARDVEAKRTWVRNHYEPDSQHKYQTLEGKLRLLEAILSNGWIAPTETLKLQCLGITFGDALVQRLGMQWVIVDDAFGTDPALRFENSSVLAFPLTSISKRVERGEQVDVRELFLSACNTLLQAHEREA